MPFRNNQLNQGVELLESSYLHATGLSIRILKRFMQESKIQLQAIMMDDKLKGQVRTATAQVSSIVGRKKMQGYIHVQGEAASKRRISIMQQSTGSPTTMHPISAIIYMLTRTKILLTMALCSSLPLMNNRVERSWQEVNWMVGYPMKYAFILKNAQRFGCLNPHHLFATSTLGCAVP
uniref:Uncharacterized protein n=1 Tax=Plectus sambesii TaxID=2011161 RepID=A0A914WF43_9BILA